MHFLPGVEYIFKNRGIYWGSLANEAFKVWLAKRGSCGYVGAVPRDDAPLSPLYNHSVRNWTLHRWSYSHFLLHKEELAAFFLVKNSPFPVSFKPKALKESPAPCSPSAWAPLCMPCLQSNQPFLQPQQIGWAFTFQCRKGLTKLVPWKLL